MRYSERDGKSCRRVGCDVLRSESYLIGNGGSHCREQVRLELPQRTWCSSGYFGKHGSHDRGILGDLLSDEFASKQALYGYHGLSSRFFRYISTPKLPIHFLTFLDIPINTSISFSHFLLNSSSPNLVVLLLPLNLISSRSSSCISLTALKASAYSSSFSA